MTAAVTVVDAAAVADVTSVVATVTVVTVADADAGATKIAA